MNDTDLQQYIDTMAPLAATICARLHEELGRIGFQHGAVELGTPASADFRLARDPVSGTDDLVGTWRDRHGYKIGELLIHADGSFYAEHDVVRQHPSRSSWFVEAVTAWGRGDTIKSEARLLPGLE